MKRPWALPLVPLYAAASALRWTGVQPRRLNQPVISIGSLSAGGAGKTPLTIALARLLMQHNKPVDILSRGYGRTSNAPTRVNPNGSAEEFGDEPLLIARETGAPVYVAAQRFEAGQLAEFETRPTGFMHLLDDGFQHRQLHRDINILLVSPSDLDDHLLPAGNRREPLSALKRADVFAIDVAADPPQFGNRLRQLAAAPPGHEQPIWRYDREVKRPQVSGPITAFCGIARPEQFFQQLEFFEQQDRETFAGIIKSPREVERPWRMQVAAKKAFPDHHRYTARDLEELRRLATQSGSTAFVTTAKDAVRLGPAAQQLGLPLVVADLHVTLLNQPGILNYLFGPQGRLT